MGSRLSSPAFRLARAALLLLLAALVGFPFFLAASVSLQTMAEINAPQATLLPASPQWQNYANAFAMGDWPRYFLNSLVFALTTTLLSLIINSMAGFALARIPFRGSGALLVIIMVGMMVPLQTILIPTFRLLRAWPLAGGNDLLGRGGTGLYNTFAGLMMPYIAGSFGVFLCRQFYIGFPHELDDAAQMDGCTRLGQYLRIYLPLSGPLFASLGVLKFTGAFNEYTLPLVLTSGERIKTVQLALTMFTDESETKWNLLLAASLTASALIFLLFAFAQKQFVSGLLSGSVKG